MNGSVNLLAASRICIQKKKCTLEQMWADVTMRGNPSPSKLRRKPCKYFDGLPVWGRQRGGQRERFPSYAVGLIYVRVACFVETVWDTAPTDVSD